MRFSLLALLVSFISLNVSAQTTLSGLVVDEQVNAVPYAVVILVASSDSTTQLAHLTDDNGRFYFDGLARGKYRLTIQMLGFQDKSMEVELLESTEIGAIELQAEMNLLEEVEVVAHRSVIESHLGKKVLRLNQDQTNGSNALEALDNIPSVTTTPRGAVNIRGNSNVIIYINGKSTRRDPSTLRFISASSLEKIEVITNPSAEYDAEGVGGIINLVFKKDNQGAFKFEWISNLTMFTDPVNWNPILGINSSWSKEKFSLYANISYDYGRYVNNDDSDRINFEDNLQRYQNLNTELGEGSIANALIGLSFEPDTSMSIGLEVNYDQWSFDNMINQQNIFEYKSSPKQVFELRNFKDELEDELWINASLKKTFPKKKSFDISLTAGGEDEDNLTTSAPLDIAVPEQIEQFILSSEERESQRYYQGEIDYESPFYGLGTLQIGAKADLIRYDILQAVELRSNDIELPDNDFEMDMKKLGIYAIQKNQIQRIEYGLGLRLEQFKSEAIQVSNQQTFTQKYSRLFPSVQLLYLLSGRVHTIGFNYSKRINRPGFFDLNPYVSYSDPLNLETGNPDLRPEIANLIDINYNLELKKVGFDCTLYQRRTVDAIQSVISPLDENRTLATSANIGREIRRGIELQIEYRPMRSFKTTSSFTWSQTQFEDAQNEIVFNRQHTWGLRFMQQYKINDYWKLELTERYQAPSFQIQQKRLEAYSINMGVSKKIKNDRGSLTLSIRDIFNTNQYTYLLKTGAFEVQRKYKWQTRQINLGWKYTLIDRN